MYNDKYHTIIQMKEEYKFIHDNSHSTIVALK